jgi:hypothetical protein
LRHHRFVVSALASVVFLHPRAARADEEHPAASVERKEVAESDKPAGFSQRGRIVFPELAGITYGGLSAAPYALGAVGGGLLWYSGSSQDYPSNRSVTHALGVQPSADVVLANGWTVGGTVSVSHSELTESETTASVPLTPANQSGYSVLGAPRFGRAFDLGPITLWPKLGVGYGVSRMEQSAGALGPAGRSVTRLVGSQLALDVVLPLSRYVIFDVGPSLAFSHRSVTGVSYSGLGDGDSFSFGMQAHLGVML